MTQLQEKLLEMLRWYHEFCISHNLRYYAIGGTTLGAVRHNGFIPWDDDIDVGMPRVDYERLKELAVKEINGKTPYLAEYPSKKKDYVYTYAKLYDTRTTMVENTRYKTTRGIFIDIFPMDGVGDTMRESLKWFHKIDRLNSLHLMMICAPRQGRSWYKNLLIRCCRMVPERLLNHLEIARKIDALCARKDFDAYKYVANIIGNAREREIMDRTLFGTPKLWKFESIQIYVEEKAEEYLRELYGKWEQLPPKEKQVSLHDYLRLDLDHSYICASDNS